MLKCTSAISKITNRLDRMSTILTFPTSSGAPSEYKKVLHCEGYDCEEFSDEIMEAPLYELFFTTRIKMLSRPDGFLLYGNLGLIISPLLHCYIYL